MVQNPLKFTFNFFFYTEESRPIESFQKISYNELFENEIDFGSQTADARGMFGEVHFRDFRGQKVAVKFQKLPEEEPEKKKSSALNIKDEISTLRYREIIIKNPK